jgi:hypothetical protein
MKKNKISLIKNILDDNLLSFAEKIISMKNVETHRRNLLYYPGLEILLWI